MAVANMAHMSDPAVAREALALLTVLLEGPNKEMQAIFFQYHREKNDELFFAGCKTRLRDAILVIKEVHDWK